MKNSQNYDVANIGDFVRIKNIVLKNNERPENIPNDTKLCDLIMFTKGILLDKVAKKNEMVSVKTLSGRIVSGELTDINHSYTHTYGDYIPELLKIGTDLKQLLFGGDNNE